MTGPRGGRRLDHRLVLDLQATQSPAHADRGVARYVREQARALVALGEVEAMLLNPNQAFPRRLDQDLLASPMLRWSTMTEVRRVAASADGPLAYYVMSPFEISQWVEGDLPPHLLGDGIPLVTTLYDLVPLLHADRYLADPLLERRYRARTEIFERADVVLTISEHTRRDAIEHLGLAPERVTSIGAGVAPFFSPASPGLDDALPLRRHLPEVRLPYVFTLTGGDPRKNTERLIEAWGRVPPADRGARQLVVRCDVDPPTRARWAELARAVGLADGDIAVVGWIPDEVLRALYRNADLFVFPPIYEGYGLPVAEAIASGCPAVTSSTSAMPGILDWPPSTFDPTDVDDIAATVARGLTDEDFRSELSRRGAARRDGLTWEAVAERTVDALAQDLPPVRQDRGAPVRTSLPTRIALVGPMPPTASGIADYNARLAPALASRCELDVYSPVRRPPALADLDARWFPPHALGRTTSPWAYDAVVYTLGNSDDHHDLYELAQELPGVLWMHDVRLPGLYLTYARERVPDDRGDDFLLERLLRQYRRRLPRGLVGPVAEAVTTPFTDAGIGLSKELVDQARGVVVSSALAERLLRLDQQPDAATTPSWVVPLGAPPLVSAPAARRAPTTAPVIACFGMVAPVKGPELLIASLPTLLEGCAHAGLVLVGPVDTDYEEHLRELAVAAGVADAIEITGEVGADEYHRHLAEATCAVQLRLGTNGESSAAVLDCLAAATPVVTNVAAAAELPPGTVDLVAHDIDGAALGRHLLQLLARPDRLSALGRGGLDHAASWTLDDVADRLLEVVASLP